MITLFFKEMFEYVPICSFLSRRFGRVIGVCYFALICFFSSADEPYIPYLIDITHDVGTMSVDTFYMREILAGISGYLHTITPYVSNVEAGVSSIEGDLRSIINSLGDSDWNYLFTYLNTYQYYFDQQDRFLRNANRFFDVTNMVSSINDNIQSLQQSQSRYQDNVTNMLFRQNQNISNVVAAIERNSMTLTSLWYSVSSQGLGTSTYPLSVNDMFSAQSFRYWDEMPWIYSSSFAPVFSTVFRLPINRMQQKSDSFLLPYNESVFIPDGSFFEGFGDAYYRYYGNWWVDLLTNRLADTANTITNTLDQSNPLDQEIEDKVAETNALDQVEENEAEELAQIETNLVWEAQYEEDKENVETNLTELVLTNYLPEVKHLFDDSSTLTFDATDITKAPEQWQHFWTSGSGDIVYGFDLSIGTHSITVSDTPLLTPFQSFLSTTVKPVLTGTLKVFIWVIRLFAVVLCLQTVLRSIDEVIGA